MLEDLWFDRRENVRFGQSYARHREELLRRTIRRVISCLYYLIVEEWNYWEDGYRQKQSKEHAFIWEDKSFQVVVLR